MDLYLSEFFSGLHERLNEKKAEDIFGTPNGTSIFPTIESQQKWKFSRCDEGMHLHDGTNVHSFKFVHDENTEQDFAMQKRPDVPHHKFGLGGAYTGTAQVHRANPGMLYVTLHDGDKNPTYTFKHVSEDRWRAIPKVKKAEAPIEIDQQDFMSGLTEKLAEGMANSILDNALKGINFAGQTSKNLLMKPGFNPTLAAGVGLGAGALYDIGKRTLYNTDEENEQEGLGQRLTRYAAPAALLGGTGMVTSNLFPNYYNHYPTYT